MSRQRRHAHGVPPGPAPRHVLRVRRPAPPTAEAAVLRAIAELRRALALLRRGRL